VAEPRDRDDVPQTRNILSPFLTRVALVLLLAIGATSFVTLLSDALSPSFILGDFVQDYVSARAWNDGEDPYGSVVALRERYVNEPGEIFPGITRNPHPPPRIAMFRPLAALPYRTARVIWFCLGAMAIATAVTLVFRHVGVRRDWALAMGLASLALPAAQTELRLGHIGGLLLLLIVGTWVASRREKGLRAAMYLAVAGALAWFPLFLILPLIRWRQRSVAAIAALGTGILYVTVSIAMGRNTIGRYLSTIGPDQAKAWIPDPQNISLTAVPLRWLRETFWRPEALNLPHLAVALAVTIIALSVFAALTTPAKRSGDIFLASLPLMILASPISWPHYQLLLLPFVIIVAKNHLPLAALARTPLILVSIAIVMIARLPFLVSVYPTSPLEGVLGWALPTYAILALAIAEWKVIAVPGDARPRNSSPVTR